MLTRKCFSVVKTSRYLFCSTQNRFLCDKKPKYSSDDYKTKNNLQLGDIGSKYQPFKDEDSTVVIDAYEEKFKYVDFLHEEKETAEHDPFEGINLARKYLFERKRKTCSFVSVCTGGKTGVYEIEDLVAVLKRDNAENIFVASLPQEFKYVDYICIATGKSHRHMQALAQFVKRVYKKKRHSSDIVPSIEGENSKDWIALDLGNFSFNYCIEQQLDGLLLFIQLIT